MLSKRLVKYAKSYVILKLNTLNYEKFINLLRRKNINMWDIKRVGKSIQFKISKKDYEKNYVFFEEMNLAPKKKIGISYKLKTLSFRLGFIVGMIIIFLYCMFYKTYTWKIEVIGNELVKVCDIENKLNNGGYKMPLKIASIDTRLIEKCIYENFKEFKFVEVYVEGVKLVVFVKEKEKNDYVINDNYPKSIIATKTAVIKKTTVKNGTLMVAEGDIVTKGQILVKGTRKTGENKTELVCSNAEILGLTYYKYVLNEPKVKSVQKETGKKNKFLRMVIGNKYINLFANENKFKNNSEIINSYSVPIITNIFKIRFEIVKQYELKEYSKTISKEYAKNKMTIDVFEKLKNDCSKITKIEKKEISFEEKEDNYILTAKIQLIEDIGQYIKIHNITSPNKDKEDN